MKRAFKQIDLSQKKEQAVLRANQIIRRYAASGLKLTLRQLYYQFVSKNWITNEERSYKWLGTVISDGRLAGLIDWAAIEDRGRVPATPSEFSGLRSLADAALSSYRLNRWVDQEFYAELWVEKQALAGVLEPIADELHVTLMVNKGYSSQSAMYESAQRFIARGEGKQLRLFYVGDHDPSGEDMVRDIDDRLTLFGVADLDVVKLALTMAQIEEYDPPPNPAKLSDSRAKGYIEKHGTSSWEVDALPPEVLADLIRDAFDRILDRGAMEAVIRREDADKERLTAAVAALEDSP